MPQLYWGGSQTFYPHSGSLPTEKVNNSAPSGQIICDNISAYSTDWYQHIAPHGHICIPWYGKERILARDVSAWMVLTYGKPKVLTHIITLHNWCFYFVGLVLYSRASEVWANCRFTRLFHCNEKNNLLLLNKRDKLVSLHKAEQDCRINQHLNANMAFGSAVFMTGLHHWIKSVSYVLTPIVFLYLWEPTKEKFLPFPHIFFQNVSPSNHIPNYRFLIICSHCSFLQSY